MTAEPKGGNRTARQARTPVLARIARRDRRRLPVGLSARPDRDGHPHRARRDVGRALDRETRMRDRSKLLLASLIATLLLGALVGTTSASRFSTRVMQSYRATWSSFTFTSGLGSITCAVTLEGSLHSRTFSKVAELLIGYVTTAKLNACNGNATFLTEALPWQVRYESFTEVLPKITSIRIRIVMMRWQLVQGFTCQYQSTAASPVRAIIHIGSENRAMENIQLDESALIPTTGMCGNAFLRGTSGVVTILGGTTGQSVTLVA